MKLMKIACAVVVVGMLGAATDSALSDGAALPLPIISPS